MSRRKMLAALWAKAQDKSGTRQPDEDERAAANELEDLYILLRECEVCVEQLPASVQGAIQRYYDEAAAFEETEAIVCNLEMEGSIAMVYRRELGEREWVCCTREELRWT